jgi:hypothetical protein
MANTLDYDYVVILHCISFHDDNYGNINDETTKIIRRYVRNMMMIIMLRMMMARMVMLKTKDNDD